MAHGKGPQERLHHSYLFAGPFEEGRETALRFVEREVGLPPRGNPDVITRTYGLLSVDDAREISRIASGAPVTGNKKALLICATRIYHEAQNALLKLFEEPPRGTTLILVVPSSGLIISTLRSRLMPLPIAGKEAKVEISEDAKKFMTMPREARAAFIKKIAEARDEDARQEARDRAVSIVNGVEALAHQRFSEKTGKETILALLNDISELRPLLYERSSSIKMVLEHLSILLPTGLAK